jgi:hypothetical protein
MLPATILFALAALGGLTMAVIRLRGAPQPPTWLAMLHGLLAASGLVLLIYVAVTTGVPRLAQVACGLFVLAALGGAYLNLGFHAKKLPLPIPVMLVHAGVAVTAFVLLVLAQIPAQTTG